MIFETTADRLRAAADAVSVIAPSKDARPILRSVLIATGEDGSVELSATDVTFALWMRLDIKAEVPGSFLVDAAQFRNLIRESKKGEVRFEADKTKCRFTGPGMDCALPVDVREDFPNIPRFTENSSFGYVKVKIGDLAEMSLRTSYAVSRDRSSRGMHGVRLTIEDDRILMVGTDGRRLAAASRATAGREGNIPEDCGIVPALPVKQMLEIAENEDEVIDLQLTKTQLRLRGSRGEFASRLFSGEFPPIDDALEIELDESVLLNRKDLDRDLRRCDFFRSGSTHAANFTFADNLLEIISRTETTGTIRTSHEIDWPGESITVVLDPGLVKEAVASMGSGDLILEIEDPMQPVIIREGNSTDTNYGFCVLATLDPSV